MRQMVRHGGRRVHRDTLDLLLVRIPICLTYEANHGEKERGRHKVDADGE
jgi:hypothetical protein